MNTSTTGEFQDVPPEVLRLCEAYMDLNTRQLQLDAEIVAPETEAAERERMWIELDLVLTQAGEVLDSLAATPATGLAQVQAKASILALVLRSPRDGSFDTTLAALALSVANDVARL